MPEEAAAAAARLQAVVRGYLIRKRLQSIRSKYESIVKEIEGDLDWVQWTGHFFPRPAFLSKSAKKSIKPFKREKFKIDKPQKQDAQYFQEISQSKQMCDFEMQFPSRLLAEVEPKEPKISEVGQQAVDAHSGNVCSLSGENEEGGEPSNASSDWSSTVLGMESPRMSQESHFPKAPERLRGMPGLQNYRKHLAMELLWLQQAIASRKNFHLHYGTTSDLMDSGADISASRTEGCSALFRAYLQKRGVSATDSLSTSGGHSLSVSLLNRHYGNGIVLLSEGSLAHSKEQCCLATEAPKVPLCQGAFSDKQPGVCNPGEMVSSTVAVAPLAKNVVVFRNGDPFFLGRKFVVSQRRFLTFDAFLNEVTSTIQAPVAIRSIYTPREGHRIAELSELQNGCRYVAAGFERFKRLDYANAGMKQLNKHQKKNGAQNYPGIPQKMMVTVGWKQQTNLPCVIYVFRNGDLLSPPFRMVLARSALQEWGIVLGRLSEKANLCTGAVKKLCKLNGDLISQGEELVNGEYYVAVGLEKYKDLPYFELLVPPKIPHRPFRNFPSNRRRIYNQGVVCEDGASDSALLEPAQQLKVWRVHSTGIVPARDRPSPSESKPAKKYPHQEKVTSIFHAKPCQVGQVNQVPGNYSARENESVYKRRGARQEMVDAQEVGEDEDTQVELPVDQKAAEIVEEEVISKAKGGPSKKCL